MVARGEMTGKLSIRLLKENYSIDNALSDNHELERLIWNNDERSVLYYGIIYEGEPKWKEFIESGIEPAVQIDNRGIGALLFIPVKENRYLVVSFGSGHFKLKNDAIENNFGLRVVVNSVDPENISNVDTSTIDSVTVNRRIQTSKTSNLNIFGVDIERDILKKIKGVPRDTNFASLLTGGDTLTISSEVTPSTIRRKCEQIFEVYERDDYKTSFPWIDQINQVRDKQSIERLDEMIVNKINFFVEGSDTINDIHLAPPEIVDPHENRKIKYYGFYSRNEFEELDINNYLSELKTKQCKVDIDKLRNKHKVQFILEDGRSSYPKWSIYKCLVLEEKIGKEFYVLSGGNWYKIDNDYAQSINRYFDALEKTSFDSTSNIPEKEYIAQLCNRNSGYINLDGKNIKCKNWSSPIEACDIYDLQKKIFIHIKKGEQSSNLSHLFNQGFVSAEAFLHEEEFRVKLTNKINNLSNGANIVNLKDKPETRDFTVLFLVIRKPYESDGTLGLPFFSKVILRHKLGRIEDYGYKTGFGWARMLDS